MRKLFPALLLACLTGSLFAADPVATANPEPVSESLTTTNSLPVSELEAALPMARFSCDISMIRGKSQEGITLEPASGPDRLADRLVLQFDMKTYRRNQSWSASLYNMDEEVIRQVGIRDLETEMDLEKLGPNTYFLRICGGFQEVKIFRIVLM